MNSTTLGQCVIQQHISIVAFSIIRFGETRIVRVTAEYALVNIALETAASNIGDLPVPNC